MFLVIFFGNLLYFSIDFSFGLFYDNLSMSKMRKELINMNFLICKMF